MKTPWKPIGLAALMGLGAWLARVAGKGTGPAGVDAPGKGDERHGGDTRHGADTR